MEMTPWFVNGEKPAYPGVYNVRLGFMRKGRKTVTAPNQVRDWYAYWNGRRFSRAALSPDRAERLKSTPEKVGVVVTEWRGLAQNPTGKQS